MATNDNLVISYLAMREAIGFMGLSLPFVLWFGGQMISGDVQPSISHYYHTPMQDIFVGYLFAISVFLMAYRGYETVDLWCGRLAGLSGIMVALFPTMKGLAKCTGEPVGEMTLLLSRIHLGSALVFFLTLSFICFFLFTKGSPDKPWPKMKIWRNRVYRACGATIVIALVMIIIVSLRDLNSCPVASPLPPVFAFEALAIIAFGLSWAVKGQAILADR